MAQPSLVKLPFLSSSEEPSGVWQKCKVVQDKWKTKAFRGKYAKCMEEFRIMMVVNSICRSNVLEDTLPKEVSVADAEDALSKAYKDSDIIVSVIARATCHAKYLASYRYFMAVAKEPAPVP